MYRRVDRGVAAGFYIGGDIWFLAKRVRRYIFYLIA